MSSTCRKPQHKTIAMMAATVTNDSAVAASELPAAFVSFRWQRPGYPPTRNVNSADVTETPRDDSAGIMQFLQ